MMQCLLATVDIPTETIVGWIIGAIGTIIMAAVTWQINRNMKESDKKHDAMDDEVKRIDKHLENTDRELEKIRLAHSDYKIDVIKEMNEMKEGIYGKLTEILIKMEQFKNQN